MPKKTPKKPQPKAKASVQKGKQHVVKRGTSRLRLLVARIAARPLALRERRAHKSFSLTRGRDIPRRPRLLGFIAFTKDVIAAVVRFRKPLLGLLVVYVIASLVLIGVSQQTQYRELTDLVNEASSSGEDPIDTATQVAAVFGSTIFGSLSASLTEIQQFYLIVLYIVLWLIVVWMLRHLIAGNAVRVRDALYNACAPLLSTVCILGLMLVQALPGALGLLVFSITTQNSVLSGGVAAMMFGVAALLLVTLSLYWLTSSFFAMIIVTLPGTYPMTAIRSASDIAQGRRTSLLLRLLWLLIVLLILWAIIVIPALLIDFWVKISWLPLVTLAVQVATGVSFIFGASYVFLLYRRMIDDRAE